MAKMTFEAASRDWGVIRTRLSKVVSNLEDSIVDYDIAWSWLGIPLRRNYVRWVPNRNANPDCN
jgi:hypothetical protein